MSCQQKSAFLDRAHSGTVPARDKQLERGCVQSTSRSTMKLPARIKLIPAD
jgi:hypothetical protein